MKEKLLKNGRCAFFLCLLCAAQPLLDVLSYWTQGLSWGSPLTLTLRFVMLVGVVGTAFILSRRKWAYWTCLGVCAVLYLCHAAACLQADPSFLSTGLSDDLTNYVRTCQTPFFTLAFVTFLRRSPRAKDGLEKGLTAAFVLIAAVEVLSVITGTNPYTYANKSIGVLGWFSTGSVQSAILATLFPLILCIALKKKEFWKTVLLTLAGFAMLYFFATRLCYLAIFVTAAGTLFTWAVCRKLDRKKVILILACALICGATFTVSPTQRNQTKVDANAVLKQENIDALIARGEEEFGTDDADYLTYAYEEYMPGLVDRFGIERVAEKYGYSESASAIAAVRTMKITYCRLLLEDSPASARLFGLSYDSMVYDGHVYDVENDFHGILFLYGYAGLCCYLIFLLAFAASIVYALIKDAGRYFTVEAGALGISLILCLVHAYCTCGVLRRPNSSFYLSLVLAGIWFLVYGAGPALKEGKNELTQE